MTTPHLTLVAGGAAPAVTGIDMPPLDLGPRELAANMGLLMTMGLLRAEPLARLQQPHHRVKVDDRTSFSLHELLCELRNLSWFEARAIPVFDLPSVVHKVANSDAKSLRRQTNWNPDGQLTLQTLFRGGIADAAASPRLAAAFDYDSPTHSEAQSQIPPEANAPMNEWLIWCAHHVGARPVRPQQDNASGRIDTLSALSEYVHQSPPSRIFFNVALSAMTRGVEVDHGLWTHAQGARSWGNSRILHLLALAEQQSHQLAQRNVLNKRAQFHRPAVAAARMSVHLTQQLCASRTDDTLHRAADELSEAAPNLLHWYTQAHKALRGCYKTSPLLFLPMTHQGNAPLNPSDFTATLVVAGAMATLLKAVFETAPRNLCAIRERNPERNLGADLNQLVANISLARLTAGGHYPAENHQDLRLGQTIALHILRDALAQDNRTASVSFQDFDGHDVTLQCHARSFGRGRVDFSENGRLSDWPKQDSPRRTHLTAVV